MSNKYPDLPDFAKQLEEITSNSNKIALQWVDDP